MRIAVPLAEGNLCQHFGHCEEMLFVDADRERQTVTCRRVERAPEHAPGVLPQWLKERGVEVVLAGGMGAHAKQLLFGAAIEVVTGVTLSDPQAAVRAFLSGALQSAGNGCDHSGGGCHNQH
jgi:ATP-binding protein involved in chromosome partitioning